MVEFEDASGIGWVARNGDAATAVTVDNREGLGVVIERMIVVGLPSLVGLELELEVVVELVVRPELELLLLLPVVSG